MNRDNYEKQHTINHLIMTVLITAIVLFIILAVQFYFETTSIKQSYDSKYITQISKKNQINHLLGFI